MINELKLLSAIISCHSLVDRCVASKRVTRLELVAALRNVEIVESLLLVHAHADGVASICHFKLFEDGAVDDRFRHGGDFTRINDSRLPNSAPCAASDSFAHTSCQLTHVQIINVDLALRIIT